MILMAIPHVAAYLRILALTGILITCFNSSLLSADAPAKPVECNVEEEIAAADKPFPTDTLTAIWKSIQAVRADQGLAFAGNGSRLFACLKPEGYIIYEGAAGKVLHRHDKPLVAPIKHVFVSRDGKHAALALENRTVVILNLEKDQIVHTHPETKSPIVGVFIAEDNNRVSWFEENLTLHTSFLKGGEHLESTYPDEEQSPPHSDPPELDSEENLIRGKNIYSVHFRGDGRSVQISPQRISTTYGELYLPENGQPGKHNKKPMFTGGLRAYEMAPD
jgi:hypothetical protein